MTTFAALVLFASALLYAALMLHDRENRARFWKRQAERRERELREHRDAQDGERG